LREASLQELEWEEGVDEGVRVGVESGVNEVDDGVGVGRDIGEGVSGKLDSPTFSFF